MEQMMQTIFLKVLNMSLTGIWAVLIVLIARILLKKAPKIYSYLLWGVVFLRLICPFSIKSIFSLIPVKSDAIPMDIAMERYPKIDTGISSIDFAVNPHLPPATLGYSANPLQIYIFILNVIWCVIFVILLLYSVITLLRLKMRLNSAVEWKAEPCPGKVKVYLMENLGTPFVMGIFRPVIYLPRELRGNEREYVLMHELVHIRRKDALVKAACYMITCIHWFNPFVWLAFVLMSRDMEMSCDETVLRENAGQGRKEYSESLLNLSVKGMGMKAPLAFGENAVKTRIKNILSFKKTSRIVWIGAGILASVILIGLLFSPKMKADDSAVAVENLIPIVRQTNRVQAGGESDSKDTNVLYAFVSGDWIADWMEETVWKEKHVRSPLELIPTHKIVPYPDEVYQYEIRLYNYEGDEEMAMIIVEDEWRYYTINDGACENFEFVTRLSSQITDELLYSMEDLERVEKESTYFLLDACFEDLVNADDNPELALSSNSADYLEAKPVAHNQIISYGETALEYCYEQFEQGGQTGLKGQLMMHICLELRGESINTAERFVNGQEWYDAVVKGN